MKYTATKETAMADIAVAFLANMENAHGSATLVEAGSSDFSPIYKIQLLPDIWFIWRFRTVTYAGGINSRGLLDGALTSDPTLTSTPSGHASLLSDYLATKIRNVLMQFSTPAGVAGNQSVVIASSASRATVTLYVGGDFLSLSLDAFIGPFLHQTHPTDASSNPDYYTGKQYTTVQATNTDLFNNNIAAKLNVINPDGEIEPNDNSGLFTHQKTKYGITTGTGLDISVANLYTKTYSETFACLIPMQVPVFVGGRLQKMLDAILVAQTFEANLAVGDSYYIGTDEYVAVPTMLLLTD